MWPQEHLLPNASQKTCITAAFSLRMVCAAASDFPAAPGRSVLPAGACAADFRIEIGGFLSGEMPPPQNHVTGRTAPTSGRTIRMNRFYSKFPWLRPLGCGLLVCALVLSICLPLLGMRAAEPENPILSAQPQEITVLQAGRAPAIPAPATA